MSERQHFRPWGELDWALQLSNPRRWGFVGCFGTEERSIFGLCEFQRRGLMDSFQMIQIRDTVASSPEKEQLAYEQRLAECTSQHVQLIPELFDLQGPIASSDWRDRIDQMACKSVCLDISSMPKRFFFSILKRFLQNADVQDLLVIYTKPKSYAKCALSSNADSWATLSGFACDDPDIEKKATANLIVNAGFAADGLREHLEGGNPELQVHLMIPFPAMPWNSVARSWESARIIEQGLQVAEAGSRGRERLAYHRVGALDSSSAFDMLLRLTREGQNPAALAPLGPKPISMAMCILASQSSNFPVYYAQPKTYAVDYSTGCETTHAYWIKHEGQNLYSISASEPAKLPSNPTAEL